MLAADEALLERVSPDGPALARWYVVDRPALVLGFAQRLRADEVVDRERASAAGVALLERHAGGGLVLLDESMLCLTVALPSTHPLYIADITESYRWLGERIARGLRALGVERARLVSVTEARADVAALAARTDPAAGLLRQVCYAALSPYETVRGQAKLVGLAQVRRQHAALFQVGILLRGQARLADVVRAGPEQRQALRAALSERTIGLYDVLPRRYRPDELVDRLRPSLEEVKRS